MGQVVKEPAAAVEVKVNVADPDAQDSTAKAELYEDGQVVETAESNATVREWAVSRTPEPGKHYYFVRVTQADGDMMWSAPVWVTVADTQKRPQN